VLYRFPSREDGVGPASPLTFDGAGNIYGTTSLGGAFDNGVVYELSPSNGGWTEKVLHTFGSQQPDGATPYSTVVFDGADNLYGTAQGSGNHGGVVYELTPTSSGWVETILHTFTSSEGWDPIGGLISDSSGNLYGATYGDGNDGIVYELSPSGGTRSFNVLYQLPGNGDGPGGTLAMDAAGNLYGAAGRYAFKLTPQPDGSWSFTELFNYAAGAGNVGGYGSFEWAGVVLDPQGDLYGTMVTGGFNNNGLAWEITP